MTRPLSAGPPGPRGRPRKYPPKPTGRKRGGQPGNRNRWRHGAFSRTASNNREALMAEERRIDFVIAQAMTWHNCERAVRVLAQEPLGTAVRSPANPRTTDSDAKCRPNSNFGSRLARSLETKSCTAVRLPLRMSGLHARQRVPWRRRRFGESQSFRRPIRYDSGQRRNPTGFGNCVRKLWLSLSGPHHCGDIGRCRRTDKALPAVLTFLTHSR